MIFQAWQPMFKFPDFQSQCSLPWHINMPCTFHCVLSFRNSINIMNRNKLGASEGLFLYNMNKLFLMELVLFSITPGIGLQKPTLVLHISLSQCIQSPVSTDTDLKVDGKSLELTLQFSWSTNFKIYFKLMEISAINARCQIYCRKVISVKQKRCPLIQGGFEIQWPLLSRGAIQEGDIWMKYHTPEQKYNISTTLEQVPHPSTTTQWHLFDWHIQYWKIVKVKL